MFHGTAPSPLDLSLPLKSIGNFIELVLHTRSRFACFNLLTSCSFVVPRDGSFHCLFRWYTCSAPSDANGTGVSMTPCSYPLRLHTVRILLKVIRSTHLTSPKYF